MGENSAIEWTDHTFNPWWGCVKVFDAETKRPSRECEHCYAETLSIRWGFKIWGQGPGSQRRFFGDKHWNDPVRWDRKAGKLGVKYRVFCGSMCDIFESRNDLEEHQARLWKLAEDTPNLIWLFLTKRLENVEDFVPEHWKKDWPKNVWLGVTVGDQWWAEKRIPLLLDLKAKFGIPIVWLSVEPLLGEVDMRKWLNVIPVSKSGTDTSTGPRWDRGPHWMSPGKKSELNWLIVGGESGNGARPMHPDWVRQVRDQCAAAGVPFFFKQHGEWIPGRYMQAEGNRALMKPGRDLSGFEHLDVSQNDCTPWPIHEFGDGAYAVRVGKKSAGSLLDGKEWKQFPESDDGR